MLNDFNWRNSTWFILTAIFVALDLWTKQLATEHLVYRTPQEVLPFLNWTLLHNYGAAWSFLADQSGWQRWFLSGLSAVVSVVLAGWILRLRSEPLLAFALAMILAGAIGNLYDRVTLGYVVDFISVYYNDSYFPAFNIADSAISIGAVAMILDMFLNPESAKAERAGSQ